MIEKINALSVLANIVVWMVSGLVSILLFVLGVIATLSVMFVITVRPELSSFVAPYSWVDLSILFFVGSIASYLLEKKSMESFKTMTKASDEE